MTDRPPFNCTLGSDDLARRETEDRALAAELIRHRWDGERQATLVFPTDADLLLDRFVAAESACCSSGTVPRFVSGSRRRRVPSRCCRGW